MKELEFPFDPSWINSNIRKIRSRLVSSDASFLEKKIAVLGGSTTANIVKVLDLFLLNNGIKASFYESEYGKYYEDAVFGLDRLKAFAPDVIYIYTTNRNITEYPDITDTEEEISLKLDNELQKYTSMWEALSSEFNCPIIQNNFEPPYFRLLGNRDVYDIHGRVNYITRLNNELNAYAQKHSNFFICDINYISSDFGLKEWSDPFYWHMYKYALNVNAIPYLAFNVCNIIKSIFGKNKKAMVLDLDNTLWGGVIGDDGVDNIQLGPETSSGQVYSEFQQYIKDHKKMGVVLNIASKNDEDVALEGLEHPDSILKPEDFIEIKANWNSKDENLIEIADELNLLLESLVFIDDNPAERHIVKEQLPSVSVPELGESHQYIINIDRNGFFETTYFSDDDLARSKMYVENAKRSKLQKSFSNYGEYLESLNMVATIEPFNSIYYSRIAQLTNKSNQFNLTTKRYTQEEIERVSSDKNYITLYGKLVDRFGDNGVVSVCIGRIEDETCHIELWLMSCRVLKRDMEHAMMDCFVDACQGRGLKKIMGYYYPTKKNGMVKDFYDSMGYSLVKSDDEGDVWELDLTNPAAHKNRNHYIAVEEKNEQE